MRALRGRIVGLIPLWLFLLAPFFLFPSPIRALALLGLPLLWALQKGEKGYFIRRTPLDWPIFIILLMVLVSLFATFDIVFSLPKLTGLLFHLAVFYAVVETVQTQTGLYRSLGLYLLLGLIVIALGIFSTQWLFKIPFINNLTGRLPHLIQGLPGAETGIHPNQLAGTLLWFFPLHLSLLWGLRNKKRMPAEETGFWGYSSGIVGQTTTLKAGDFGPDQPKTQFLRPSWRGYQIFLWLAFGATMGTFFLTQSRGGWVGGLAALAFLAALLSKPLRWLILAGLVVGIIGLSVIGWPTVSEYIFSDTTQDVIGNLGSLDFRMEVWRAALWGVSDFPFTGMGLGAFRQVARLLYPLNVDPGYNIADAHNQFLQAALDLGLPGLVAFVALWLGAAYALFYVLQRTQDSFIKAVAVGVAGSLFGYFVFAFSNIVALGAKPGLFFWWLLALATGIYQQTATQSRLTGHQEAGLTTNEENTPHPNPLPEGEGTGLPNPRPGVEGTGLSNPRPGVEGTERSNPRLGVEGTGHPNLPPGSEGTGPSNPLPESQGTGLPNFLPLGERAEHPNSPPGSEGTRLPSPSGRGVGGEGL